MASITNFTYEKGFYHITIGDTMCHNVPILAFQGKEFFLADNKYEMYRMTGSNQVATTVNNKLTLNTKYFDQKVELNGISDLKRFLLELEPKNVYQDHIKNQFIKTLKLWKEPHTL